ncbi:MAG: DNA topoisomerase (ATP-hydrolyzing) [Clostridia bacterium]|jgi:DNA gyrase subunit A|nr:DNA topoisomerase 4 subunit A [Clostridia bacterium]MDD4275555.1 DNA topoisomerase 4 subunit A [Clostridia bacterium]
MVIDDDFYDDTLSGQLMFDGLDETSENNDANFQNESNLSKNNVDDAQNSAEEDSPQIQQDNLSENAVASPKKTKKSGANSYSEGGNRVFSKALDEVMRDSMMPYTEYVVLDRAIPRVEDGLKPVQRRVLFSMLELGLMPDKVYRKSARVVGDCIGKYHPHGDTSVYQAMVRMAQDFNMRAPLVDGHGNFGSVDGDSAAAMRYTEVKMTPIAMELLRDLDKNTVKWSLNFDDTLKEPDTLPGRVPNLLINGASGIAVGLATNIPPHNITEVISGVIAFIDNKEITLSEMMNIIQGPDFPTGAYAIVSDELVRAYETGRGKITLRAKINVESEGDKRNIVITEMPYQSNKATILQTIAELRNEGKSALAGISEIRDESDRNGMRAVIKLKKDIDPQEVIKYLLKTTALSITFGINIVAIAGGKPRQMGLLEILDFYVNYQRDIILRRSKYEIEQAREHAHILEGLIIAIQNIDEVIRIIKKSESVSEAKIKLRSTFTLSEKQAQAILDMRLARLTNLEVGKIEIELAELKKIIEKLSTIIASKKAQLEVVKGELLECKRKYRQDRRTIIVSNESEIEVTSEENNIEVHSVAIAFTAGGTIKKTTQKNTIRAFSDTSSLCEAHNIIVNADTDKMIYLFTNLGNCYKVRAGAVPDARWRDKGTLLRILIKESLPEEKIVAIFSDLENIPNADSTNLLFFTKYGMVKSTVVSEYNVNKAMFATTKLKDGDELLNVEIEQKYSTLIFITKNGMILNADKSDVPVQGRMSGGVRGINLDDDDITIFAGQVTVEGDVIIVSKKGNAKKVKMADIDVLNRYRKGVKIMPLAVDDNIAFAGYQSIPYTLVVKYSDDSIVAYDTEIIAEDNRASKGKILDITKRNYLINGAYINL